MRFISLSTCVLSIATVATLVAQTPMRPGQWETTMQMQMANMQMPEMKTNRCVTAEELKKDPATGLPNGAQGNNRDCKVSDYKQTGSTVSWNLACSGQMAMTGSGELTFANDTYAGTMKMNAPQGAMTMKLAGKRLGDCTP